MISKWSHSRKYAALLAFTFFAAATSFHFDTPARNWVNHYTQGEIDTRSVITRFLSFIQGRNMAVLTVGNIDTLNSALASAKSGDVIKLAAGNYGELKLNSLNFSSDVTITSANPDAVATFSSVNITSSSHIKIDNVFIDYTPDTETVSYSNATRVFLSEHISIVNSIIKGGFAVTGVPADTQAGGLDATGNIIGWPTAQGISVHKSNHVIIENNDISSFFKGIVLADVSFLKIEGNNIHDLRTSPIVGGDVSDVLIANNTLTNSNPWQFGTYGDHGDFIHLWTTATQEGRSKNIEIRDNFISEGSGFPLLGIYIEDNGRGIGHENVSITNNVIFNGSHQAIRLENVIDSVIDHNTLLQSSGTPKDTPQIILRDGSDGVVITNNIFGGLAVLDVMPDVGNNIVLQSYDKASANFVGHFFFDAITDISTLAELQLKPDTYISGRDIGAAISKYNQSPAELTALFATSEVIDLYNGYKFDATPSAGPLGILTPNDAQFLWDFGDGTTANTATASHQYSLAGEYQVILTVRQGDKVDTSVRTITIAPPELLFIDFTDTQLASDSPLLPYISADGIYLNQTDGAFTLSKTDVPQLFGLDEFRLSFSLKGSENGIGSGDLMRVHSSWTLSLTDTGRLKFAYTDQNDKEYTLISQNAKLDDQSWHEVELAFDSDTGRATFYLDGKDIGSGSIGGPLQAAENWGLAIGNPFGPAANAYISQLEFHAFADGLVPQVQTPDPNPQQTSVGEQLFAKEKLTDASEKGVAAEPASSSLAKKELAADNMPKEIIGIQKNLPDVFSPNVLDDVPLIFVAFDAGINTIPADSLTLDDWNDVGHMQSVQQGYAKEALTTDQFAHSDVILFPIYDLVATGGDWAL